MNEQIKLFEKQCWDYQSNCLDAKKFAKLIVQECIDYCGENLSKTVAGALKIHLGIEE